MAKTALDDLLGRVKQILTPAAQGVSNAFQAAGQFVNTSRNNLSAGADNLRNFTPNNIFESARGFSDNIPYVQKQTTNRIANFSLNTAKPMFSGIDYVGKGLSSVAKGNPVQGAFQAVKGVGQVLTPFSPLYQAANLAASSPRPKSELISPVPITQPFTELQRFSSGLMRGISQDSNVASNVTQEKTLNLPFIGKVDPYAGAGEVLGFVKNPVNDKFFKWTEKILPAGNLFSTPIKKWLTVNASRGGIEGIALAIADMPENISTEEKFKFLVSNGLSGSLQEILGRGAGDVGSKGFKLARNTKMVDDMYKSVSEVGRKLNVPVQTMKLDKDGNRITVPMWKYELEKMGFGLSTKDINELSPEDYAKVKGTKPPVGEIPGKLRVKPNLTQQVAGSVPGVKLKVKPTPAEAPIPETFPIKPGELNVNTLNLSPEQKADLYNRQGQTIISKLSNDEIKSMAESMGIDKKTYTKEQIGAKAAEMLNSKGYVQELEKQLDTLKTNNAPVEEITKLNKQIDDAMRASASQGTLASHLLSVRKIIGNDFLSPRQKVFTLLQKAGVNPAEYTSKASTVDFNNPNEVVDFYRSMVPPTFGDWLDVVRYNSMLSSPVTHMVNITSNLAGTGMLKPVLKTAEGGVDALASALNPNRPRTRFAGEGVALAKGYYSPTNIKSAYQKLMDVMTGRAEVMNPDYKRIRLYGSGKGKVIEDALNITGRALEGMDQFFTELATQGYKASNKYRTARGGKVKMDPGTEATRDLFRGDLVNKGEGIVSNSIGDIGNKIAGFANSKILPVRWFFKMTIPFLKVGTNLAKEGLSYNPVTGAANLIKNEDKINQVAKMAVGGAVMATAIPLALNNNITFGPPSSTTERDARKAANIPDYGLKIGNTWIKYDKFHPALSFQLAMVAALTDAVKRGKITDNTGVKIAKGVMNWMKFGLDQTYYKNVSDTIGAIDTADPSSLGSTVTSNWLNQTIPFRAGLTWLNNIIDQTQRKADVDAGFVTKTLQNIASQLPGASFLTPARVNAQGEEVKKPNPWINLFSPWKISQEDTNSATYLHLLETQNQNNKDINDISTAIKYNIRQNEPVDNTGLDKIGINSNFLETQKQKAEDQIYKQKFEMSGAKWAENNGKIYMNDEGTIRVIPQQDFEKSVKDAVFSLASDRLKREGDAAGWLKATNEYMNFLQEYQKTLDPTFDQAKILSLQNKIEDLGTQAAKYINQGGFTKKKKMAVKKMPALKITRPKFARSRTKTKKSKLKVQQPKIAPVPIIKVKRTK